LMHQVLLPITEAAHKESDPVGYVKLPSNCTTLFLDAVSANLHFASDFREALAVVYSKEHEHLPFR